MKGTVCRSILLFQEIQCIPQITSPLLHKLSSSDLILLIGRATWQGRWIIVRYASIVENRNHSAVGMLHSHHYISMTCQLNCLTGVLRIETIPSVREQNDRIASLC